MEGEEWRECLEDQHRKIEGEEWRECLEDQHRKIEVEGKGKKCSEYQQEKWKGRGREGKFGRHHI